MAKSTLAIRVFGDNLEPSEITNLLGSEPSSSFRTGDRVSLANETIRKYGMWSLSVPDVEPEDYGSQIDLLLSKLTRNLHVWHSLAQRFQVDLFCGFFMNTSNQGFTLPLETITTLAAHHIEIGFDVYSPVPEQEKTVGLDEKRTY